MADNETAPQDAEAAEPFFDPSLKKKKKKTAVALDALNDQLEAADTPAAVPNDVVATDDLDFSDLKLKKKKKKVVLDLDEGDGDKESGVATPLDGAEEFADLKKKKKKGGKKAFDMEAFEKELAQAEAAGAAAAPGTPGGSDDEHDDVAHDDAPEDGLFHREGDAIAVPDEKSKTQLAAERKAWLNELDRDYTYDELLGRFYQALFISHPSLSTGPGKKRYTVPPPIVQREGNKRSIWANVGEICKKLHRQPEHVIQFLFAELGTNGSVDGQQNLVIKGRFQQKQIETVLRRYIVEYVTCKTCKSPDTLLEKDNRLYFVTCETCGSKRSVTAIKTGFSAQIGKRKATNQ